MKKLAVLLLTALLFFNWCGYRLLTSYWEQQADRRLQARLDHHDYDESSLFSIKVSIQELSYYNASSSYERIEGEIIIRDIAYKYVKRRMINDSLELICIRNTEAMEVDKAGNEFFGKVNNLPGSKPVPQKDILKVYSPENLDLTITKPAPIETPKSSFFTRSLSAGHIRRSERPPAFS